MAENPLENRLLKILVLGILAMSIVFGLKSYTVDSEFWSVTLAQYFFQPGSFHYAVYNKPLFYLLLNVIYWFPMSSLTHVVVAKTLFVGNALLLSFFSFRVFLSLTRSATAAWIGLIFLITNPVWFAEAFRIRSDLLAMMFTLWAVSVGLRAETSLFRSKTMLALFAASFLTTPKSALWNIPLMLCFVSWEEFQAWAYSNVRKVIAAVFSLIAIVMIAVLSEPVRVAYGLAWSHFLKGFARVSSLGPAPWIADWFFVVDAVKAAPGYWALMVFSLAACPFVMWKQRRTLPGKVVVFLLCVAVVFSAYSPKLYFFIATYVPLFMIPFVLLVDKILQRAPAAFVRAAVLFPLVSFVFWAHFLFPNHEGASTYRFLEEMDRYTAGVPMKLFDSMGLLPRANNLMLYISEADDTGNTWVFERVLTVKPELIFETMRIATFFPQLKANLLQSEYVEIQKSFWLKRTAGEFYHGNITEISNPPELFGQRLLCVGQSATPYMRWDFSGLNCF